ncbi:Ionotropic receptor 25a [Armadillidium vulgare]|nr:Ionotropic receptor 25a [Armadillidium vulgare]
MDMNGEFAFIHDSAELKYQVYHNCYLTEVGEPFAEQPYAIAVQQGSHLQDEISKTWCLHRNTYRIGFGFNSPCNRSDVLQTNARRRKQSVILE